MADADLEARLASALVLEPKSVAPSLTDDSSKIGEISAREGWEEVRVYPRGPRAGEKHFVARLDYGGVDDHTALDVVLPERQELVRQVRELDVPRGSTAEAHNDTDPLKVDRLDDARNVVIDREQLSLKQRPASERPVGDRGDLPNNADGTLLRELDLIESRAQVSDRHHSLLERVLRDHKVSVLALLHSGTDGDAFGDLCHERRDVDQAQLDVVRLVRLLHRLALVDELQHDRCGDLLELDILVVRADACSRPTTFPARR